MTPKQADLLTRILQQLVLPSTVAMSQNVSVISGFVSKLETMGIPITDLRLASDDDAQKPAMADMPYDDVVAMMTQEYETKMTEADAIIRDGQKKGDQIRRDAEVQAEIIRRRAKAYEADIKAKCDAMLRDATAASNQKLRDAQVAAEIARRKAAPLPQPTKRVHTTPPPRRKP